MEKSEKREKLGAEIRFLGRLLGEIIRDQAGSARYELEEEIRRGHAHAGKGCRTRNTRCRRVLLP